ncbi:hypothetical protein BASA83_013827 [Batrachochytrium salamandrivorans]|nr:hypothetical protein BASA83_013827 [Batrachochytrium salamandrivorans]
MPTLRSPDGQPGEMNMFRFTYTTPVAVVALTMESQSMNMDTVSVRLLVDLPLREVPRHRRSRRPLMKFMMWVKCGHLSLEVYWSLVPSMDFRQICMMPNKSAGNIVAMQNIIGGLMTQPCNPTFLSARDAIVAADASYYKGANKCEILKAFAKRGLGSKATSSRKSDFSVHRNVMVNAPSPDPTTTTTEHSITRSNYHYN